MQALRFFVHPQVRHWKLLTENSPHIRHAAGSFCPSGDAEGKEIILGLCPRAHLSCLWEHEALSLLV